MNISDYLVSQIREGRAVMFLGAGASRSAVSPSGKTGPTSNELGGLIAGKFLGGKYSDYPLNQIAEYAICESDLASVQEFIKGVLDPLGPTAAHLKLPSFVWHGLATTNYDRLIERAYERTARAPQVARPLIENGDRVEENLRGPTMCFC